ncbi:MAG: hypothetical protein ACLGHN_07210 [Bacteriovoracia bacterium]
MILKLLPLLIVFSAFARPEYYNELVDYVQPSPDQGEVNTCLFMANTGAMELLANKQAGIKNPVKNGPYDLSESYSMWARSSGNEISFFDTPVHRFNGEGIHNQVWPFEAWVNGEINYEVWNRHPEMNSLPRVELPEIETIRLFQYGNKWSTYVLDDSHVEMIKEALWKYKSPILINYNDDYFWHVILIVGYDDRLPGSCHDADPTECSGKGSFYVRDSFGIPVEVRDYGWFRVKGNAAFVVKLK